MSEPENSEVEELRKVIQELRLTISPMADRISDFSEIQRRQFWRLAVPVYLVIFCFVGTIVFTYFKLTSGHVTFVTEGETKTMIGVKGAGRIQANTDDRTGETIIEVYHAKK